MEYRVVSNESLDGLYQVVEANLLIGWRLQGGIAVGINGVFY